MYKNVCRKIGSGENLLVNTGLVISSINFVFYRKENLDQLGQMVTLWVSLNANFPCWNQVVTVLRLGCCKGATILGKKNFALSYPLDAYLVDFAIWLVNSVLGHGKLFGKIQITEEL